MALLKETNMNKLIASALLLNAFLLALGEGQQGRYPNLEDVKIGSKVVFVPMQSMYFFDYTLTNSNLSEGDIAELDIDIGRPPNSVEFDTSGLLFQDDGFTERSFRRNFERLRGKIVPVGFITKPRKWTAVLSDYLTATFFTTRSFAIHPGQSLSGFSMMTRGLPSVRRCIVSPLFDVVALFPDPEDSTVDYYVPPIDSVRRAVKFYAWTVGPTAPPAIFVATYFLDTLISYKHQALALKWIDNEGVANSLDQKLENAKDKLSKGDSAAARNILEAFVNEVEAQKDKHLTSEAYALLKFNAEYLIDRLPESTKKNKK
jgi:hypothetical protein